MCETCVPSTQFSAQRPRYLSGVVAAVEVEELELFGSILQQMAKSLNTPLTPTLVVLRRTWRCGDGQGD